MSSKLTIYEPVALFGHFLEHAKTALLEGTYAGTIMDLKLFPNMAFHFKAFGGWPSLLIL
jgi:hypothetical protein